MYYFYSFVPRPILSFSMLDWKAGTSAWGTRLLYLKKAIRGMKFIRWFALRPTIRDFTVQTYTYTLKTHWGLQLTDTSHFATPLPFPQHTLTVRFCPGFRSWGISMENSSLPVIPSFSAFSPPRNCNGMIPIPTKFDLWILSKLSATTALTPCKMQVHTAW